MLGYLHYLIYKWFYWFIFYSCPRVIDINLKKNHPWNLFKRQLNLVDNEVFYKKFKIIFFFHMYKLKVGDYLKFKELQEI